ncbi:phosphodiesterase [Rathayibacter iranicus]|uniref:Phosphodiesterase n=2 Tax=Rathayibacter iranicus TaxID=59737 RepID=A0AAD1ACD0_9MICO|nr:phosphodiesterase [Rathayibacter iranicus]AZZ55534.1 phosphodiesterase [Rathayibacter iranicus]MWV31634.1 phosphodiesterase [Rathayibacter iranicus NCPPB 2253 = VKM Ac-1602]PPI48323.1 phosphodiesterase [Rathayibacter iranicus]PPI60954.1 phosphodiesterase [Rathayibacter iranicus]PPI72517.1 phosphodiesterase [Rathayibacter iranicus]
MSLRQAEYPRPHHFILHLSDTHFIAGDGGLYGSDVDSEAQLRLLFDEVEESGGRPEAIVITGDLADKGAPEAYAKLRAIVEPAAERLGAEVVWVMGNHDDRGAFRAGLLDQLPTSQPIDRVHDVNGLRIIALDSTVPGAHHGEISSAQLDWLAEELSSPAPHGTILALHHPPVPSVLDLSVLVELRDQPALAEVLEGSDVRSIIAGHLHYSSTAMFAGIPVSVASATCYTQDLNVAVGGTRARNGAQAFNLIHVYDGTVLHSVVPIGASTEVSYVSAVETQRILAEHGVEIAAASAAPLEQAEALYPPLVERTAVSA